MYLPELSAELNIPVQAMKSFLASRHIEVDINTNLSQEEEVIVRDNAHEIKSQVEILNIQPDVLEGPKVISKIDLSAIDSSTRPKKSMSSFQEGESKFPRLVIAASEFNVPLNEIVYFLVAKGFSSEELKATERMTEEMYNLTKDHFGSRQNFEKLDGPKILGKIELPVNNGTRTMRINTTPRVMAAAKEFNIGKDTLVDYLVSKGFDKDDLKPTAKIKEEMYLALVERFQPDRLAKLKSDLIQIPKSTVPEERNHWKGIIDDVSDKDKVKIDFIRYERTYKNGKPIVLEKPDKTRWTFALREYWHDYVFNQGEKIFFSIQQIDKGNRKVRVAMPPLSKSRIQKWQNNHPIENKNDRPPEPIEEHTASIITEEQIDTKINKTQTTSNRMNTNVSPLQRILFGSPGTGKSYQIVDADNSYFRQLVIDGQKPDLIKTVFHPEYTYGDFMGKLMPLTNRGKVEYRYYSGHFMLALGTAYKNIIKAFIEYNDKIEEIEKDFKSEKKKNKSDYSDEDKAELQRRISEVEKPSPKNVLLVIDEINRGNSAAIFGTVFQLLDRDNQGWSSYPVKISDLELKELLNVTGLYDVQEGKVEEVGTRFCGDAITRTKYDNYVKAIFGDLDEDKRITLAENNIKMPPNLSIIATMNTSDNSIYFMDSAFKRRWDWEFVDITSDKQKQKQSGRMLEDAFSWDDFVDNLNEFIKKYGERIRKIEDKQIGYYFIKGDIIKHEAIRNKLMFFLWDSIFNNDKKPIRELIGMDKTLVTFGDFIKHYEAFIEAIKNKSFTKNVL